MAEIIDNKPAEKQQEELSSFDLHTLWVLAYLNWYWVVLSVVVALVCGFMYLRYAKPVYSAQMKMLVKDSDNRRSRARGTAVNLDELGIITNNNGFDNELEIIKSGTVCTRAVRNLKLYVDYQMEGRVRDIELYKNSPILVDLQEDRLSELKYPLNLTFKREGKGFIVEGEVKVMKDEVVKKLKFTKQVKSLPAQIPSPVGRILVQQNPGFKMTNRDIYVTISSPERVGFRYSNGMKIAPSSKTTTVAIVSITDTKSQRIMDFMHGLVDAYNEDANEDKNEVAEKTEIFIRERIEKIKSELDDTEGKAENYKRSNKLINITTNATADLAGSTEYQKKQVEMQTQITLFKSLIDYMDNPENNLQVIPANLGLDNQYVTKQIEEYNKLVLQRNRLLKESSETNPTIVHITDQCLDMWPVIQKSLNNVYHGMLTQKQDIDSQYDLFLNRNTETPMQERVLTNIGRQQEIQSSLYLALLQKREENFLSLAGTAAKSRVIDFPIQTTKVSPNAKIVMGASIVIGAFLPLCIFYLLGLLRYRIEGREDVLRLTKLEILCDIPFYHRLPADTRAIVVHENRNNMMEETFRGLRTNLGFVLRAGEKVILVTSCIPGEGKTFVASNLAMSLALLGKRVVVIGLDVRKPQLVKLFKMPSDKRGIVPVLATSVFDSQMLEAQITHGVENPNLDVMPAGIIPPNPAELISRDNLDKAVEYLKTVYDYIIIDTPPIGLVSDALSIGRVANVSIVVARADYSPKANFDLLNEISRQNKLPRMNLVLNGVDLERKKYGYYYGYGKYGKYGKYGYGKYGKYGYGKYGRYGHYGVYGNYGSDTKGREHIEK